MQKVKETFLFAVCVQKDQIDEYLSSQGINNFILSFIQHY